jgi:hypothetical protein
MRLQLRSTGTAACLVFLFAGPGAAAVQIIANAETAPESMSAEDVESIFLGKRTLWGNGAKVLPAMPGEADPAAKEFIESILNKTMAQYQGYWKRRLFSGGGTEPRSFGTQAAVVDFVGRNPGAIAVVSAPTVGDRRVKVVSISQPADR